ncbi:HDOD domain-containing protein [Pelomonas aquatica]|jgi:HD-like signal output (HDOD) protein|uniref:HDOD domain-containing protein n=1 Tax=Pelomonas aquatica TaxID=431058 RepID=A0A9X4R3W1_9BURK|nr:HDOD domain-containing protein [Pelomonas aquatica]MCY4755249.1 HDOD domain-containing protein [Pelomonas aquatica]MDG0862557.1 HDOD domain-containing protein [Pelomonas aquatica]
MPDRLRLTDPLSSLDAWVDAFARAEIPVLAETAEALEQMRATEDDVDAHGLGELIATDPLMTLKVLAHANELKRGRSAGLMADPETVTAALVLMGITPFFRDFGPQPTLEAVLADHEEAQLGLSRVMQRAERASRFALGFAAHRADPDAAVIHSAALLHDFAEMLLWVHAPDLALQVAALQDADRSLRSAVAQRQVLGVTLTELEQALMKRWHLPELLTRITGDKHERDPQVRCVHLAVRLARHTARGWDDAAVPDDLHDIAELLNLGEAHALKLLHEFD